MEKEERSATLDPNLSRRLHRALIVGKEELYRVLEEPSMEVLATALKNRALDGNHLLVLLKRRDLSEELLKAVYRLDLLADSHELKVALVRNPSTPGQIIAALLPQLYLFELATLCSLPGVTPDQKLAAERAIIQRLPVTPLGNKLTLARRGTPSVTEALLREGEPRLLEACLDSPRLKEAALFRFLTGATASAETVSMVARHPRWKNRPNLRLVILKNPKTPAIWFTLHLPQLPLNDVKGLLLSNRLSSLQKSLVEEELKRRGIK